MEAPLQKAGRRLNISTVGLALLVRALFVLHNVLAVWRVAVSRDNGAYWGLAAGNVLILFEALLVVCFNGGLEWKWWCPCFLTYLLTVLPSIWLLQLTQNEHVTRQVALLADDKPYTIPAVIVTTPISILNVTIFSTTQLSSTTPGLIAESLQRLLTVSESTWIVLIQESLVYIIVFGRWMLPRNQVSREALSDLLLQYLAMASDSMELYAIFDEEVVQKDLQITYAILAIWSLSFIQFIPVLVHKRKSRHFQSVRLRKITRACGEYFAEVVVTVMSIMFQDGPFMCLRLYIMVGYDLVTYSLVFFVLKNIVTLMILIYRLVVLCRSLPGCYKEQAVTVGCESVDFSSSVTSNNGAGIVTAAPDIDECSNDFHEIDEVRTANIDKKSRKDRNKNRPGIEMITLGQSSRGSLDRSKAFEEEAVIYESKEACCDEVKDVDKDMVDVDIAGDSNQDACNGAVDDNMEDSALEHSGDGYKSNQDISPVTVTADVESNTDDERL